MHWKEGGHNVSTAVFDLPPPITDCSIEKVWSLWVWYFTLVAVRSSGILKGKEKLGITFNSDELGGIDFTKFS